VLTQDPPMPEFIGAGRFVYQVKADGTIQIEKELKKKK
jgi:hypothetical protein